jgi:hypothetical protein
VRPRSVALAALALASVAAASSALLDGCALPSFTLQEQQMMKPDAAPDVGRDVEMMPETGPPSGCVSATYPDPPGGTDDGTTVGTLVFALHSVDLGDLGSTPGYDLDNTCTCLFDGGPSCVGSSPQLVTYCDGPGGIDNQALKLFDLIQVSTGVGVFGSAVFSTQANAGRWSLLIRLDGWNGKPNDPQVKVALFPSSGTPTMPLWMGGDTWRVSASSVGDAGIADPLYVSDGAYVSNGVLVGSMPTGEVTLQGGASATITVRLSAGVLTGTLTGDGPYSLRGGIFAGRWALKDVFKAISSYRNDQGAPICTSDATYSFAKGAICVDADILVDGTQPKSAPCDAFSMAIGFEADPALLGAVTPVMIVDGGCPEASDPQYDKCN